MTKFTFLTAAAISLVALSVAAPASAAKINLGGNINLLSSNITQDFSQDQSNINPGANPLNAGANIAVFSGFGANASGSQSLSQTQSGFIIFPFLGGNRGQVNIGGNLDLISPGGNTQKTIQNQTAHILFAVGGPVQVQIGGNVSILGSKNKQTVDQSQTTNALLTVGTVQRQAGVNVVFIGDGNTQSVKQSQTENAFGAGLAPTQSQLGVNAVVVGNNNKQSIDQSQTDTQFIAVGPQDNQAAVNVIVGGNNNTQTATQKQ